MGLTDQADCLGVASASASPIEARLLLGVARAREIAPPEKLCLPPWQD
jgi:hypothetical protein